ncbi:Adventurous gliding motility protein I [Labilithrix luteola]|uniref:Adventurous gliding motility protein I n=1 Tax=Labilithrix luteola TaxID=1391654 RepID=A0A0K1Q7T3_9BACT|nr:SPOR domain-containing protein [Labilithrix luteola]AKV01779.1 Adventurous gliding motility protein I [Labilithrix luteola]
MMEQSTVRNLEQIQEDDGEGRTPRGVTILLVALGGACVVFAGLALGGRHSAPSSQKSDPLGELVNQQAKIGQTAAPKATDLNAKDVTFPGILSDDSAPTTALAAVKGAPGAKPSASAGSATTGGDAAIALNVRNGLAEGAGSPPPATDRLPVVPLPAQHLLEASPVVTRPRDSLTRAANDAAQISAAAEPAAPPGREGGYQLQVSSFRSQSEAEQFAVQLRARSHKAYVVEAHVPGRGTWYRVRIGPFATQHAASSYRSGFEGREHVVPFIVPPSK